MAALVRFARLAGQSVGQAQPELRACLSSIAYRPSQELLDQEPLGAWRHPAWTQAQADVGAVGAFKILEKRLTELGPQRQHQLAAVLKRISTPEEAALGLHAIQLMRRYRARHQQHEPFNKDVVWIFLQACAQAEAWDTMVAAFQHNHELGLGKMSLRLYGCALAELRKAGELHKLVKVFETMPQNGVAPSRQIGRLVLKACTESQQPELAEAFREEFQLNGVQVD